MSRGTSLNDDFMDDFHQDADEERLTPYKAIIAASKSIVKMDVIITPTFTLTLDCKLNRWRRFWLWFFLGIKTEICK